MRRAVYILPGLGLILLILFSVSRWWTSREIDRLSAALDADLAAWSAEAPARPVLFGDAIPGEAMEHYDRAFASIVNHQQPQGVHRFIVGHVPDQLGLRNVLENISKGARSTLGPVPGARWDGRPFDSRPWSMVELKMQITSDATWGQNARLSAGRATPPSPGPDLMFLVEHMLGLLRMQDDFSRSVGGVHRDGIGGLVFEAVLDGTKGLLSSGGWTVDEARALERGLVAHLASMPTPEECLRESNLALQSQFRAALRGRWPVENYDWGRAAKRFMGTRHRILSAWRTCREGGVEGAKHDNPVLQLAFKGCGPQAAARDQRWQKCRYEQFVLGLRAFLHHEEHGKYPTSLDELLAAGGVREHPEGGCWEIRTPEHFHEWEIGWVDPDGKPDWRLGLGRGK